MLSRCFRMVYSELIFAWFARLRDSNFKMRDFETCFIFYELEILRLQLETPKFRDSPKICRDPLFFKDHSIPLQALSYTWGRKIHECLCQCAGMLQLNPEYTDY